MTFARGNGYQIRARFRIGVLIVLAARGGGTMDTLQKELDHHLNMQAELSRFAVSPPFKLSWWQRLWLRLRTAARYAVGAKRR